MAMIAENMYSIGNSSQTFTIDWDTEYLDIKFTEYSRALFGTNYYYDISNNLDYDESLCIESAVDFGFVNVPDYFLMSDFDTIRYSKDHGVLAINENGEIVCEIDVDTSFANNNEITIRSCVESADEYDGGGTFDIIKSPIPMNIIAKYTFNSSIEDTFPVIQVGYTYEYTDVDNGDGTITRTITSYTVPEFMKFTDKKGLLSLDYFDITNIADMCDMFSGCSELKSLDIRNFDVNKVTDITNIFTDSNNIKIIRLDNSDMNTINTIISLLPERIFIGKLYITNVNDVSGIDKTTAASKKWKIVIKENRMNTFAPINLGNKSIRAIYTNNESYL